MTNIISPIVALLTPFNSDDQVDFAALDLYLDYLNERGIKAIVVNGTTAEFCSLSIDERKKILEFCRANFDGTIINNVSSTCLEDVKNLLRHSQNLSDYALVLPPYYYAHPKVDGVYRFFDSALASTDQPVFLYNFPLHTKFEISLSLIERLASKHDHLVGIKDSNGNLETASSFKSIRSPFFIFVGSDRLSLAVLERGLAGSITGAGSSFPECLVKIRENFSAGKMQIANEIQYLFNEWNNWRKEFGGDEIAVTKQVVATRLKGFPVNVRAPVCLLSETEVMTLKKKTLVFEEKAHSFFQQISRGLI